MAETMVERIARCFHDTYEELAPNFGYETRKDTRTLDLESPNGQLMCAVIASLIFDEEIFTPEAMRDVHTSALADGKAAAAHAAASKERGQ